MEQHMKKTIMILAAALMAGGQAMAQVVQENEAVVVYYMPKTELVMTLDYDVITETPGVFYQYAQRYLGANEVITESKITYSLTAVEMESTSSADMDRAYQVVAQKGLQTQLLTLSTDGRLMGYGCGACDEVEAKGERREAKGERQEARGESKKVMPLLEEQFIAGTTAKMAEGAAKQIYRIREMRLNLLAGEVEHVPADGKAMELVLAELSQREEELVALFVGTRSVEHKTHTLHYAPEKTVKKEVVCRFSQHSGVVKSDDLSGSPIYVNVKTSKPTMRDAETGSKVVLSPIYYNLPGLAQVDIEYNGQVMCKGDYAIAQLGVAIPLSSELFIGKETPIIRFNPETGNIQSIEQ